MPGWDHLAKPPPNPNTTINKARPLMVTIPDNDIMCDGYIDDGIFFGVEKDGIASRLTHAGPVVTEAIFRTAGEEFDQNRNPALSADKLAAELSPDISKKVLGWIIQTTMFRVFLPIEKCLEWTQDINTLIKKKIVSTKEIESTIGRLNHAGHILPLGRYFLTRLRYRLMMCKKWGKQKLAKWDCEDLELWIIFLENASQKGININNITYTRPTDIGTTDACETGMGGYLEDGRA